MGTWSWLGPRLYDPFLALGEVRGLRERRSFLLGEARGRVLEIGAGTGLNVPHYPPVDELVLTEPDGQMARSLHSRVRAHPASPTVVEAPAERLPFEAESFDTVISTMVLCTVPDPVRALAEVGRVLRPSGRLLFIEHIRSANPRVARRQDRLQPAWKPFALGCHCNRDTLGLLRDTGWKLGDLEHFPWRGMPFIVKPTVAGSAATNAR